MTKYLVDTISTFLVRYVVDTENEEWAMDSVIMGEDDEKFKEFSQKHLGYQIASVRQLSDEQYLFQFDQDNDYLKDWTNEQKFRFVNKVDDNES